MDELARAQAQLDRTLEKANMGADRALASLLREEGNSFLNLLVGGLRMTRVHELSNHAFDKPVQELVGLMAKLSGLLGTLHVVVVEDQVYLNDVRVRLDPRSETASSLRQSLGTHGCGGLSFHEPLSDAQIRAFIRLVSGPSGERPRQALREAFKAEGLDSVELLGSFRLRVSGEEEDPAHQVDGKTASLRGEAAISEAWENLGRNRMPNPLPLRRAVGEILEAGLDGQGLMLESAENAHGAHSVRVARLAMLIARELGLSRSSEQDLGVAGLVHDMGYANLEGASDGEPGHAPPFERHASAGARLLLRQRGFHESKIRRLLAVLEHHLDVDAQPSLFGRILRVAEDYDNLSLEHGPARTLRHMAGGAGRLYDPLVVQALINRLGRYPPGTVVELEDGRRVLCTGLSRGPDTWETPTGTVLCDKEGEDLTQPCPIDLAEHAIKGVV